MMKKIGHETLFLPTGENNPRNGESTFARLTDGRILFAYTQYVDTDWSDHADARICGCYSSDEGESWTQPVVLIERDPAAQNIMSPTVFLMPNGQLGIVYLRKDVNKEGFVTCMPVFSASDDNGRTWSKAVYCNGNGLLLRDQRRLYHRPHGQDLGADVNARRELRRIRAHRL